MAVPQKWFLKGIASQSWCCPISHNDDHDCDDEDDNGYEDDLMSQIMLCENWHHAKSFSPFEDISASRGEYVRSGGPSKKSSSPHPPDQLNQSTTLTTNVKLILKEVNRTPEEEKWCKIWSWHLSKSVVKTTINASQSGTRPHRFGVLVHQQQWTRSQRTTL